MTTTVSALEISSRAQALAARSARGGKDDARVVVVMLLAPVVLMVLAVLYTLVSSHHSQGLLAAWTLLWFAAFGAISLAAGSLRNAAFSTFDAVRESQARRAS
jgi:hypothetical protein